VNKYKDSTSTRAEHRKLKRTAKTGQKESIIIIIIIIRGKKYRGPGRCGE